MSAKPTLLIARKSVRARLGRTIAITVAITAGVSFVVGSFVLADSLRATFDDLFGELTSNVDLQVRSSQAFESDDAAGAVRPGGRRRRSAPIDGRRVRRADGHPVRPVARRRR